MLLEKITTDLKDALKSGDSEKAGVLRMVISAIRNKEIAVRSERSRVKSRGEELKKENEEEKELTDEDILDCLKKELKKRKEAAELFKKGGRDELAEKENKEAKIISEYLPAAMSREEIEVVVDKVLSGGAKDFSSIIKEVMKELKGKAEGKEVSEIIKEKLG